MGASRDSTHGVDSVRTRGARLLRYYSFSTNVVTVARRTRWSRTNVCYLALLKNNHIFTSGVQRELK